MPAIRAKFTRHHNQCLTNRVKMKALYKYRIKVFDNNMSQMEAPPPMLRFVPVDNVLLHEEADQQRYQPLVKRIVESGIWLHPPIVAPLPKQDGHYVVLDGANRTHSIKSLKFPHILVQIVNYDSDQVRLETWSHVVSDLKCEEFLPAVEAIAGIQVRESDKLSAQAELAQRNILAFIMDFHTNVVYSLHMDDHSLAFKNSALRSLVATYKREGKLDRTSRAEPEVIRKMFPRANALVVFPHYEPAEILVAARDNEPLPPGISRHVIQGRAMRLNYPLDDLRTPHKTLAQKNKELAEWVLERIDKRSMRFYAESTYVFDE